MIRAASTDWARDGGESRPAVATEPFEELWQRKIFDLLLKRGKINESLVTQMLGWQHSGVRRELGGATRRRRPRRTRSARSMHARCSFGLQRMIRITSPGKVLYLAEWRTCRRIRCSVQQADQKFPFLCRQFQQDRFSVRRISHQGGYQSNWKLALDEISDSLLKHL